MTPSASRNTSWACRARWTPRPIAINEQRFAPNIKNVVSTDEFGHVAEGNVGEFLKFLPGVTVEYGGGYARGISLNGVPSANVPITIDGFNLASTGGDNNTPALRPTPACASVPTSARCGRLD